jgi:hypothetical protein
VAQTKGHTAEDYAAAYDRLGSFRAVAEELGVNESSARRAVKALRRREDPAIAASMHAVGTGMRPKLAWAKTKPGDDGLSYSVLLKPEPLPDDTLYRIREAFEAMEPAVPVIPPENVLADLCNVIPLFDVHFGMRAWGLETGGPDYDVEIATADLKYAFEKVLQLAPMAERALLIIGGDFFHADDSRSETPGSKHKLDTDGRHHRVIESAIEALGYVISRVQARHKETVIRVLRGNHDEHSHMVLTFAHHGDRAPPERLTLYVSDVCPFWSETRHRHFYTGHIHKDTARDIGPLRWESLRAFCPPDAYAAGMGYAGRRAMRIDTYHKADGRVLTAMDPIERDAR